MQIVVSFTFDITETADLLQKLSLDSQTNTLEGAEPTKKVLDFFCFSLCYYYYYYFKTSNII